MDNRTAAKPLTTTVPDAGARAFGLGRNGSYDAAKRGEIPVIRVGRKLRVPLAWLDKIANQAA